MEVRESVPEIQYKERVKHMYVDREVIKEVKVVPQEFRQQQETLVKQNQEYKIILGELENKKDNYKETAKKLDVIHID